MKILITGSTGFIGSHLAEKLLQDGHDLVLLVLDQKEVLESLAESNRVTVFETKIINDPKLDSYLRGVEAIYHLAAIRHRWGVKAKDYLEVNTGLTRRLLEVSKRAHVKQFIFCSSIAVFGWPKNHPIDETFPYAPNNPYGRSKVECEKLVKDFCLENKIKYTTIRPSMTYGERDYTGFVTKFINLVASGKYLTVGSGQNRLQLVYIDDLCQGFDKALANRRAYNEDFIVTNEKPIKVQEIEQIISSVTGKKIKKPKIPRLAAYPPAFFLESFYWMGLRLTGDEPMISKEKIDLMTADRSYSIDKAKKLLDYKPTMDFKEGIKKVYLWNKKHNLA